MKRRAYVGIGSNLGDPAGNVERGIASLREAGSVTRRSSLYRTKPWGVTGQPDYVNAVVLLETALPPLELLAALQDLERRLGRVPAARWGPRVIDFDILTYDDERFETAALTVPHPRMERRAFVLVPLAEIDPRFAALRDALDAEELGGVTLARPSNELPPGGA